MSLLWWLAETTIVAAVLAMVVGLICLRFGARLGPGARHALWLVVLLKLLTPPLFSWPSRIPTVLPAPAVAERPVSIEALPVSAPAWDDFDREWNQPPFPAAMPVALAMPDEMPVEEPRPRPVLAPRPIPVRPFDWSMLVSVAIGLWLMGALVELTRQAGRIVRFSRRLRSATEAPDRVLLEIDAKAERMGIAPPRTLIVDGIGGPMLWCWGTPLLLIPTEFVKGFDQSKWSGVIIHELAHLKRGDHWVARLDLIAGVLWWFSPVYRYTRSKIRSESELACDAWVLDLAPESEARRAYAEVLVEVCEHISLSSGKVALGFGASEGLRAMEGRLTMILRDSRPNPRPGKWAVAAGLLALLALPGFSQDTKKPSSNLPVPAASSVPALPNPVATDPVAASPAKAASAPAATTGTARRNPFASSAAKAEAPRARAAVTTAPAQAPQTNLAAFPTAERLGSPKPHDLEAEVTIHREFRFRVGPEYNRVTRLVTTELSDVAVAGMTRVFMDSFGSVPKPSSSFLAASAKPSPYDLTRHLLYRDEEEKSLLGEPGGNLSVARSQELLSQPWQPTVMPWRIDARAVLRELIDPSLIAFPNRSAAPAFSTETFQTATGTPMTRKRLSYNNGPLRLRLELQQPTQIGSGPALLEIKLDFTSPANSMMQAQTIRARMSDYVPVGETQLPRRIEIISDIIGPRSIVMSRERDRVSVEYKPVKENIPASKFRFIPLTDPNRFDEEGDGPASGLPDSSSAKIPAAAAPPIKADARNRLLRLMNENPFGPTQATTTTVELTQALDQTRLSIPAPAAAVPFRGFSAPASAVPPYGFSASAVLPHGTQDLAVTPIRESSKAPAEPTNVAPEQLLAQPAPAASTLPPPRAAIEELSPPRAAAPPPSEVPPAAATRLSSTPSDPFDDEVPPRPTLRRPARSTPKVPASLPPASAEVPSPVAEDEAAVAPATRQARPRRRATAVADDEPALASPPVKASVQPATIEDLRDQIELLRLRLEERQKGIPRAEARLRFEETRRAELEKLRKAGAISASEIQAEELKLYEAKELLDSKKYELDEAKLMFEQAARRLDREALRLDQQIRQAEEEIAEIAKTAKGESAAASIREAKARLESLRLRRGVESTLNPKPVKPVDNAPLSPPISPAKP